MNCRYCGCIAYRQNTYQLQAGRVVHRRRKCSKCRRTFQTIEVELTANVLDRLEEAGAVQLGMLYIRDVTV